MNNGYSEGLIFAAEILKRIGTPYWSTSMDSNFKHAYDEIMEEARKDDAAKAA